VLSPSRKVQQDAHSIKKASLASTCIPGAAANPRHTKNASKMATAYLHGHKTQLETIHSLPLIYDI